MSSSAGWPTSSPSRASSTRRSVQQLGEALRPHLACDATTLYRVVVSLYLRYLVVKLAGGDCLPSTPEINGAWSELAGELRIDDFLPMGAAGGAIPDVPLEGLVSPAGSPLAVLTHAYEQLLQYCPLVTHHFQVVADNRLRKAVGAFYTPRWVVRLAVNEALSALVDRAPILDPAMGTGVFLHEALGRIAGAHDNACAAEEVLYGYDRDPLAVQLAILALWLETGARPSRLRRHLRIGDPLADPPRERFAAVIGNPPWGAATSGVGSAGLDGRADSFKEFLALAGRITTGAVGMVVPDAMFAGASHADIRELLLERLDPYAGIALGDGVFRGAAAPACVVVFGPKPGPHLIRCGKVRRSGQIIRSSLPRHRWNRTAFPLTEESALSLLQRLQGAHPSLADLAAHYQVRDVGINYNRAAVARRLLYEAPEPDDSRDLPRYRGRDFHRYTAIRRGGWLRHDLALQAGERFSLGWSVCREPEKIVLRQTADRLIATLDRTHMALGRSVIAITATNGASLPALLACLNSRVLTVLYRVLAGEEGRVLAQVKVGRLHALPIPDGGDERWLELDRLAQTMLEREGRDAFLDQQIDWLVADLYGLSASEAAVDEGAFTKRNAMVRCM